MKIFTSFSSEKSKCVVCNKVCYDYVKYEENGISISISKHTSCILNTYIADDIKNSFKIIKTSIRRGKL